MVNRAAVCAPEAEAALFHAQGAIACDATKPCRQREILQPPFGWPGLRNSTESRRVNASFEICESVLREHRRNLHCVVIVNDEVRILSARTRTRGTNSLILCAFLNQKTPPFFDSLICSL
jgi:hypothetical protein